MVDIPLNLGLYLITDSTIALNHKHSLEEVVEQSIRGGATIVQIREKHMDTRQFIELARRIHDITKAHKIPLLVNDRLDVALAIDAEGVHVGQDDMPVTVARRLIGPGKIIGATVASIAEAKQAEIDGANYLGTDAIFPTLTKTEKAAIGLDLFGKIVASTHLPVVAVGGIKTENISEVMARGASGIAVVSALNAAVDIKKEAAALLHEVSKHSLPKTFPPVSNALSIEELNKMASILASIRKHRPLIHHITNFVVMHSTANATLAVGGSPVMAHAIQEVEEMTNIASALLLNMGTLDTEWVESGIKAGNSANKKGIPIVLDPVGAGATQYRTTQYKRILQEISATAVKGNFGEVATLVGEQAIVRGVDSEEGTDKLSGAVAKKIVTNGIAKIGVVTGKCDFISNGSKTIGVLNGCAEMGRITGTGCIAGTILALFTSQVNLQDSHDLLIASVGAMVCIGLAGEKALHQTPINSPGSFSVTLIDALAQMTPDELVGKSKLLVYE